MFVKVSGMLGVRYAVTHRYIDTANDNNEAVAKLIKLFNGAKWRGRFLK